MPNITAAAKEMTPEEAIAEMEEFVAAYKRKNDCVYSEIVARLERWLAALSCHFSERIEILARTKLPCTGSQAGGDLCDDTSCPRHGRGGEEIEAPPAPTLATVETRKS